MPHGAGVVPVHAQVRAERLGSGEVEVAGDDAGALPAERCARSPRRSRRRRPRRTQPSRRAASPCQTTGVAARTAYEKIWDDHALGSDLLYVDLHLVHEVTSPQAFEGLRLAGRTVRRPDRTHRDGRPQRAHVGPLAPDRGRDLAAAARCARAQRRGVRHPVLRPRPPAPGHRPRDRPRARHHAAGHDDRLRRLAHLDARRVRRARVRHRHERGRARAGHADAAAEARAHAARDVRRRARARRRRQGPDPRPDRARRRPRARRTTSWSTTARSSARSRWKAA